LLSSASVAPGENVVEGCVPNEARRVRVQLIRVHEDGTCARWRTEPGDLSLILVLPARAPRKAAGVAS